MASSKEKYKTMNNNNRNLGFLRQNKDDIYLQNQYDLLKIFISLFYYEKSLLSDKKEYIFNDNQKYYLINYEWLEQYKEYYNYSKIYGLLMKNDNNYNKLYYHNLDKEINNIIKYYSNKDILNFDEKLLSPELSNIKVIKAQLENKNNILIYKNCYIINSEIMDMIKKYFYFKGNKNNEINFEPKTLYASNNNIYIIDNVNIVIGNINKKLLYNTEYILSFKSLKILNSELKQLLTKSIEDYIISRKCIEQNFKKQKLKSKNNEEIGLLVILKIKNKLNNNSINIFSNNKKRLFF